MFRNTFVQMQKMNAKLLRSCPTIKIYEELRKKKITEHYSKLYTSLKKTIQMREQEKQNTKETISTAEDPL